MKIKIYILFLVSAFSINAQNTSNRNNQLKEIAEKIQTHYIFEQIGKDLSKKLNLEIQNGIFNELTNQEFADSLTSFLAKSSNDLHFNVLYKPNKVESKEINMKEILKRYDAINKQWNYGFEKVQRLDGNIAYIQYTGFPQANKNASEALEATMNFVSNTNALIIDLRNNNGGDSEMVELFLSYFFKKKIKLSSNYTRYNNKTSVSYTIKSVSGKKYLNKPVYFLVSNRTISAAEALAYELQKRIGAIVIGEKTYGAANPIKAFPIDNLYELHVPITEVSNTITKTNWEHVGVDLDIKIEQERALAKAHSLALENLLKNKIVMELSFEEIKKKIIALKMKI